MKEEGGLKRERGRKKGKGRNEREKRRGVLQKFISLNS